MGGGRSTPLGWEDLEEGKTFPRRDRFVYANSQRNQPRGGWHMATIHVGFLRNENKGTNNAHFIPPDFHEMMTYEEIPRSVPGGSEMLSFSKASEFHKARERYRVYTKWGGGPFSWVYNKVRDFITSRMMKDMDFKHCELAFDQEMLPASKLVPVNDVPYGPDCLIAYGTNLKDGEIFRKPRTFKPRSVQDKHGNVKSTSGFGDDAYEWINLRYPKRDVQKLVQLIEQEVGKPYDASALERLLVFPKELQARENWDKQGWHCTNFTVSMLQQVGFLNGMDPNCVSADDVYHYLKDNQYESVLFKTPARMQRNTDRVNQQLDRLYCDSPH